MDQTSLWLPVNVTFSILKLILEFKKHIVCKDPYVILLVIFVIQLAECLLIQPSE